MLHNAQLPQVIADLYQQCTSPSGNRALCLSSNTPLLTWQSLQAARVYQNQPYDESLEVPDSEDVASLSASSPVPAHMALAGGQSLVDMLT